jgi:hypothetical protein
VPLAPLPPPVVKHRPIAALVTVCVLVPPTVVATMIAIGLSFPWVDYARDRCAFWLTAGDPEPPVAWAQREADGTTAVASTSARRLRSDNRLAMSRPGAARDVNGSLQIQLWLYALPSVMRPTEDGTGPIATTPDVVS